MLDEKKLTPAEKKKREEIAQAIERENPDMPMDKKMAIATATAKRVAEAMEDDDNKPVDTARTQRTGDFKLVKYRDPVTGKIRFRKQKKEFKVESVQEAKDMYKSAANELKNYAKKSGGIDAATFHAAAKHIENIGRSNVIQKGQHLGILSKHLRDMDTSPREKVLSVLHKHGHDVSNFGGYKMRRESMDKPPFEGPYTKASEPKKDQYGNVIKKKNIAKHLAKKAATQQTNDPVSEEYTNDDYKAGNKTVKVKSGDRAGETGQVTGRHWIDGKMHFTIHHGGDGRERNSSKHPGSNLEIHRESVEEAVHPDHVSLHPHKTDKKKYTVGQVGRNVKGRLKTGEHLNDTQVDDLHDMGMKVKHERKPFNEGTDARYKMIKQIGDKINKEKKQAARKAERDAKRAMSKDKDMVDEADNFDRNFKRRIALKVSGPKSVRDYETKKADQRKDTHAKQDPRAVKQGYGPGVIPPGTAYRAATKRGMSPSQAANAVSNAFKNRGKPRKLPEETELHEGVIDTLNTIVKSRGAQEVKFKNGQKTKVDVQTANVLTKVHKSLNSTNAKKFADKLGKSQGDFMKLLDFAYTVTR